MATCGIYKITNKLNNHAYVGMSINIEKRFSDHKSHYLNSSRADDQRKPLYLAFKKYGIENFNFEIIEECSVDKLKEREIYWIKYYNTYENREHYNLTPGGDMPGSNTAHLGEEHGKAKLTENDVVFCRNSYQKGLRSRDIWESKFKDKINYSGFLRMWHGQTWKHIKPEVFKTNPHPAKYKEVDCEIINALWLEYQANNPKGNFRKFVQTENCYVGYGTAWKMVHNPEFYTGKK